MVNRVREKLNVTERRACRVLGQARSTQSASVARGIAKKSPQNPQMPPKIRMSMNWMPSKPSPMNMDASRPPAARPASGPNQREAPLAAAGVWRPAWFGAAWVCCGAWRV